MLSSVLNEFGLHRKEVTVTPYGTGLINDTWKIDGSDKEYILQRVNDQVFKDPFAITHNVRLIAEHLQKYHPDYNFLIPEKSVNDEELVHIENAGYFRLMPFVKDSRTFDIAHNPSQAYEAAKQFGRFTRCLSALDTQLLKITLPDFHNLPVRYKQFEDALKTGNKTRIAETKNAVDYIRKNKSIVDNFKKLRLGFLKVRVIHHDTKISNVLFDHQDKGMYVIDLDTVMPGYFISDMGDMIRTYLSPANEEEKDFSRIMIRHDFYEGIKAGYLSEMKDELEEGEADNFIFAGKFMIYMQAIRFLTDYLRDDVYYGSVYEGQNKVRAYNQIALLKALVMSEKDLLGI